jgi:hypothetical protein
MDPNIWGPNLWFFIHTIALNFPNNPSYQEIRYYEDFFNNLKYIIPCDKCKLHYTQRLEYNPIIKHLKNSDTLFRYTIDLHNDVNKSLNKKIYSYEEVIKIYKSHYNGKTYYKHHIKSFFSRNAIPIVSLIAIIIAGIYYKKKYIFKIHKK